MPTHDFLLRHFRKMLLRVSTRGCIHLSLCTLDALMDYILSLMYSWCTHGLHPLSYVLLMHSWTTSSLLCTLDALTDYILSLMYSWRTHGLHPLSYVLLMHSWTTSSLLCTLDALTDYILSLMYSWCTHGLHPFGLVLQVPLQSAWCCSPSAGTTRPWASQSAGEKVGKRAGDGRATVHTRTYWVPISHSVKR